MDKRVLGCLDEIEECVEENASQTKLPREDRSSEELEQIDKLRESLSEALSLSTKDSTPQQSHTTVDNKQVQPKSTLSKSDTELPKKASSFTNARKHDKSSAGGDSKQVTQNYIPPLENPYEKAWKFLSKHDILTLFQGLTANIVATKPECPLDFMIQEIEKLQEQDRVRKGVIMRTQPQTDQGKSESS